jgi:hypothetical protein
MVPSVSTDTVCWTQHVRRRHKSALFNESSPVGASTHFLRRTERKSFSERLLHVPNDVQWTKSVNPKYTDARKIENVFPPYRRWLLCTSNIELHRRFQQILDRKRGRSWNCEPTAWVKYPFRSCGNQERWNKANRNIEPVNLQHCCRQWYLKRGKQCCSVFRDMLQ